MFNKLSNISVKNADEVYSISKYLAGMFYEQTGIKSKVKYIPYDKKRFNINAKIKPEIKQRYKNIKGPILLYVGRISPHKGIHLLIKAFNLVLKEYPDAALIIAGKPTFNSYFNELRSLSKENIIFTGFVEDSDLPSYYKLCEIYTTCTLWEGYDLPVVEAQACGKYVVAFDIGPHSEIIKNGALIKESDVEQFAAEVVKYLRKKKNKQKK